MIGFYTKFTTKESYRDGLLEILAAAGTSMYTIDECLIYIVNTDVNDSQVIWVTEIWTDPESHLASLQLSSSKELIAKAMPLMTARPEQIKLVPISGKGL